MGFIGKTLSFLAVIFAFKAGEFVHPKVNHFVSNAANVAIGLGDFIGLPLAPYRCNYKSDHACITNHRWLANKALEFITPPPELATFAKDLDVQPLSIPSSVTTGFEIPAMVAFPQGWKMLSLAEKEETPVVVYFHGGGWFSGNILPDPFLYKFANDTNAVVVQVDYRVSPEQRIDVIVQDCIDGFKYVIDNAKTLGVSGRNINTAGISAGGFLTVAVEAWARDNGYRINSQFVLIPALIPYGGKTESYYEFNDLKNVGGPGVAWFWNAFIQDFDCRTQPKLCDPIEQDLSGSPPTVGKLKRKRKRTLSCFPWDLRVFNSSRGGV